MPDLTDSSSKKDWIGLRTPPFSSLFELNRESKVWDNVEFIGRGFLALMVPIVAIISFDDLFFEQGLGLLAGMTLALGYAAVVIHKTLRRGDVRKSLGQEDPLEVIEECRDFPFDVIAAIVLAFLVKWTLPTGLHLLELGELMTALAVVAGSLVLGVGSALSLKEGLARWLERRSAEALVDEGRDLRLIGEEESVL